MKKIALSCICAAAFAAGAYAQEAKPSTPSIKLYGFIRNYFTYDSREASAGTEDLFYYMPKDESLNAAGEDLNAISSFRFAALTSRFGLNVTNYEFDGYKIGAKIETDFYSGVSGVSGTATLRLRQAFATVAKDNRSWKIGQAWHPLAADMPDIFSLETGVPFNPFSRTPQVAFDYKISKRLSLNSAALWQMQYNSTGPDGQSANYIKYGCTPELFLGLTFKSDNGLVRVGGDMLSIKPRNVDPVYTSSTQKELDPASGTIVDKTVSTLTDKIMVKDRLTTFNAFLYTQYKTGGLTIKEKLTYVQDGSHLNMVGGYGKCGVAEDGHSWNYSATSSIAYWATLSYANSSRFVPSLFIGYMDNLGTSSEVSTKYQKNSVASINQMLRIQPEVVYNLGKLQLGLEYMLTAVEYGKDATGHMVATDNLHMVLGHRVQGLVKFTF